MAADDVEVPWDDQTDQFIDSIDQINYSEKHYDISLRDLLLNPNKYLPKPEINQKITDMQAAVNQYFDGLLAGLADEQKELDQELASTDMQYTKIDSVVSTKSASTRVPYIKPYYVSMNQDAREEILIEAYTEELDPMIGKLTNISNYVADLSGSYKEHKFGSWLFSGEKNYVITIRTPSSIIMDIERSSGIINDLLASIASSAKSIQKQ